jgi:hypothetical protein
VEAQQQRVAGVYVTVAAVPAAGPGLAVALCKSTDDYNS